MQTGKELKVSLQEFDTVNQLLLPILWCNGGMYGVISVEKVANMQDALQDQEKLPVLDRKKDVGKFYWDEVEIIPPKIAKLLFGETK
jgi:hypothetical protein